MHWGTWMIMARYFGVLKMHDRDGRKLWAKLFWMKYSSQRVWNPVWACTYARDTVASGRANNRIFDWLRWWHLNSLALYTVHFCLFYWWEWRKINTVCWMLLLEAQIRGKGRVALKVVTVTLKSFSPWGFFLEKVPTGHIINIPEILATAKTFSCGLELKHQKWILDDGHWVKSRAKWRRGQETKL